MSFGVQEEWRAHEIQAAGYTMRGKVFCLWPRSFMSSVSFQDIVPNLLVCEYGKIPDILFLHNNHQYTMYLINFGQNT